MTLAKPSRRALTITTFSVAFTGLFSAIVLSAPAPVLAHASQAHATPAPNTAAYYTQEVQPIFQKNCYRCHGSPNHRGGLQLDNKMRFLRGGKDGAVIVPGHPESSLLISLIRHQGPADNPMPMPPKGGMISNADIAIITTWIKAGAIMPDTPPMQ